MVSSGSRGGIGRGRPALVYHAGALGDFVLSLPAILRVEAAHPGAGWSYWGPAERLALLPGFGPAPPALLRHGHTLWGDRPHPEAEAALGGAHPLLAFTGTPPPPWLVTPASARITVDSFRQAAGAWVPLHQARQLDRAGVPRAGGALLPAWRRAVLPRRDPREIVLHPGSGDPAKNLPLVTWLAAAGDLRDRLGLPVRALLGPVEAERGDWTPLPAAGVTVTACSDLPELLAHLARAALFLGNDSGVAHLAGALGIPTVVAYGPSDPSQWRPLGPRVRVVSGACDAAPCSAGGPIRCDAPTCLGKIEAARLVAAGAEAVGDPV